MFPERPADVFLPRSRPQDALWSAYFGLFYRKYFFDFLNGIVRAPGGIHRIMVNACWLSGAARKNSASRRVPGPLRAWESRAFRPVVVAILTERGSAPSTSRPAASDSVFIAIIVKAPIVQILNMVVSLVYITLDYPAPFLKNTVLHRSFPIRIVLLCLQTFLSILYYQGTNAAIYSFIAALCYVRAQLKGEVMPEAKGNKGRGGRA
ncbi:hypothetical protein GSI_08159 [Ganoderma sinense ZZ0214-1]|uniref:DUF7727 domain-containing protein n=1 Tax=Ganoderma sinense ZZ0214-1 TaxID=1077348 RepID=A0A2G8S7I5_9APHY|nr:hypothetical protein GSI_08159 [Ganoderma sinense ZZ0214-1]